ncbi:MAG: sigma-70 family RNA polymerase sigma factor [Cruoricaptor ignavus]|nr:sigma-70 family RNA polymerase sigma factor [Cruoricaptor ignavus]
MRNFLDKNNNLIFNEIYEKYHKRVYLFISKYVKSTDDICDITQNVFVHLWNYRHNLSKEHSAESILFKTSKQEIANWYRSEKLSICSDDEALDRILADEPESALGETQSKINQVIEIIKALPEKRRTIFEKSKMQGLTYTEIATEMHLTEKAVERHISKALKFIRANLSLISVATLIISELINN